VTAVEKETELLLIAGEPLDQTVFQYGPFVMTTRQEIMNTLEDCK
jgi:redox-sensitive bicupin YhaK (pirin superfamily)